MYNLVIVDDEEIMRDGLIRLINWNQLGFDVVNQFEDGKEAIEFIKKNRIDVILADIKMTFVSGLELAQYIKENALPVKIVLLSGYKDFNYAQKAVDYNVVQYLLKPVAPGDIRKVFQKIKNELDCVKEHEKILEEEKKRQSELLNMLRQQFFMDIVYGALRDRKEIEKRFSLLNENGKIENSLCCLFNIELNNFLTFIEKNWDYSEEDLYTAVANFITVEEKGITYNIIRKKTAK